MFLYTVETFIIFRTNNCQKQNNYLLIVYHNIFFHTTNNRLQVYSKMKKCFKHLFKRIYSIRKRQMNRKAVVASRSRGERACKRTGAASVPFCGKEEHGESERWILFKKIKKPSRTIRSPRRRGRGECKFE